MALDRSKPLLHRSLWHHYWHHRFHMNQYGGIQISADHANLYIRSHVWNWWIDHKTRMKASKYYKVLTALLHHYKYFHWFSFRKYNCEPICFGSHHIIIHDDVIKWKHFPRNWPFVREIHRSPVNFPHKGQWRGALMFSLIYAWINDWVNNREAGDLRRQHGHYDVIVMICKLHCKTDNLKILLC